MLRFGRYTNFLDITGFSAAMLDVMDIEDESPQELLARAEREGLDLRDFAVDEDADDGYSAGYDSDEDW